MTVTIKEIRQAAAILEGNIVETPCLHSRTLSELTGAEVYLKFENLQFTAAFKERGAFNKLIALTASERVRGVIAASAGNHAQGVAYHAKRLGIGATIVMPRHTPHIKVERTRSHGAQIVLHGDNFDAAKLHALELARDRRLTFIHPYDDELVIAGQGTIALEMLATYPELQALVIPIGGGGLIAGMAIAAKAVKADIDIVGVQTQRYPSMYCAITGESLEYGASTIAEGIAVAEPGKLTLPIVRDHVTEILLIDEGVLEEAIVMLLEVEKTVAEGAGAAGLAALLAYPRRFKGQRVGIVLCGGNIDPLTLAEIIERGLVRSGRLTRLIVELRDLPGTLAQVTACLAANHANIEQVHHQRKFTQLPVQTAKVEFVVQTRNHAHAADLVRALGAAGFKGRLAD